MKTVRFILLFVYLFAVSVLLIGIVETRSLAGIAQKFAKEGLGYSILKESITIIALLFGILSKHALDKLDELEGKKKKIQLRYFLKDISNDPGFYRASFISPIVYYFTFLASDSIPDDSVLRALYLSYVNGFFWKSILGKTPSELQSKRSIL